MVHEQEIGFARCALGELFRLVTEGVVPATSPRETFVHYSIPALDELGGPARELGSAIESNKTLIREPCILVSKLNPRKPRVVLVDPRADDSRHCASTEFMAYAPRHSHVSLRFFRWYLASAVFQDRLERVATGSTNSHVRARPSETLRWGIPVPSLPEQRLIAEILDTLDEAIRKTEQLIAKLKQVKQGLLHDLLTRGIDENGELRDPERHPEQFKDSPLGRVPRGWEVVRLRNEASIEHGYAFEGIFFSDKPRGPILLTPGNFHRDGGLYFTPENTKYFTGPVPKAFVLNNGELLTVMTDLSPRTLILGRVVLLNEPFTVLHNQRIGKIVCHSERQWTKEFLAHVLNSPRVRAKVVREATGTTVRHTSPGRILSCFVPRPPRDEQERIDAGITALRQRMQAEKLRGDKLRLLKQGLMEDLLTGRVRVTALLGEHEREATPA